MFVFRHSAQGSGHAPPPFQFHPLCLPLANRRLFAVRGRIAVNPHRRRHSRGRVSCTRRAPVERAPHASASPLKQSKRRPHPVFKPCLPEVDQDLFIWPVLGRRATPFDKLGAGDSLREKTERVPRSAVPSRRSRNSRSCCTAGRKSGRIDGNRSGEIDGGPQEKRYADCSSGMAEASSPVQQASCIQEGTRRSQAGNRSGGLDSEMKGRERRSTLWSGPLCLLRVRCLLGTDRAKHREPP